MTKFWGFLTSCRSAWCEPMRPGSAELADILSQLQLWPLVSLQPLDQNQYLVPHLKDLLCIGLEIKAESFWMTFNIWNICSKYPYFNRVYVVSGGFGCPHLYRNKKDVYLALFKELYFKFLYPWYPLCSVKVGGYLGGQISRKKCKLDLWMPLLETGSNFGDMVGYQIRLENNTNNNTLLTYCTNGVLLRTLMGNLKVLNSVTHVIVDEIHERDKFR